MLREIWRQRTENRMLSEAVKGLGEGMFGELQACHQSPAPSIDLRSAEGEFSCVQRRT